MIQIVRTGPYMENYSKEFHEGGESKTHVSRPYKSCSHMFVIVLFMQFIEMCEQIVCGTVRLQNTCVGLSSTYTFISVINSISQSESQTEVCKPAMTHTHAHTHAHTHTHTHTRMHMHMHTHTHTHAHTHTRTHAHTHTHTHSRTHTRAHAASL